MWRLKILVQFILARLPGGEAVNYLLQHLVNTHSKAKRQNRIIKCAKKIFAINQYAKLENSVIIEIGTGWDAICPVLLYLMGAKVCYTYDHVRHVRFKLVRQIIDIIETRFKDFQSITSLNESTLRERLSKVKKSNSLQQFFDNAGVIYCAPTDARKTGLPDASVDIVFSYGVLEHVPEECINAITLESKRILKENGIAYHFIGLHDHYVKFSKKISKVNFLKYSEKWWSFWVQNKISFHNRLREKQFLDLFKSLGAKILSNKREVDPADIEIVKTMKINEKFSGMTPTELAVFSSEIIMSF